MSCYTADIANFRILFPELDSVPDATVQFYLDTFDCKLYIGTWGDPATDPCSAKPEAQLYLSAHEIALSQNRVSGASVDPITGVVTTTATAGPMTSATDGALSASFASNTSYTQGSDADTYYAKTEYGQHYLSLKRAKMPLAVAASCQTLR